jgi:hypothetical protein
MSSFAMTPTWLSAVNGYTVSDQALYNALSGYTTGRSGTCFPSLKTLAARLGRSKRTIQRWLDRLVGLRIVRKVARQRPNGSRTSDLYELAWNHPFPAPATPIYELSVYTEDDGPDLDLYLTSVTPPGDTHVTPLTEPEILKPPYPHESGFAQPLVAAQSGADGPRTPSHFFKSRLRADGTNLRAGRLNPREVDMDARTQEKIQQSEELRRERIKNAYRLGRRRAFFDVLEFDTVAELEAALRVDYQRNNMCIDDAVFAAELAGFCAGLKERGHTRTMVIEPPKPTLPTEAGLAAIRAIRSKMGWQAPQPEFADA